MNEPTVVDVLNAIERGSKVMEQLARETDQRATKEELSVIRDAVDKMGVTINDPETGIIVRVVFLEREQVDPAALLKAAKEAGRNAGTEAGMAAGQAAAKTEVSNASKIDIRTLMKVSGAVVAALVTLASAGFAIWQAISGGTP